VLNEKTPSNFKLFLNFVTDLCVGSKKNVISFFGVEIPSYVLHRVQNRPEIEV
jgi:hypothetical protein